MPRKSKEDKMTQELRIELIKVALSTDVIAQHKLGGWREAAVCAARWLLRTAATDQEMPKGTEQAFKTIAEMCDKFRRKKILKTESEELLEILERFKLARVRDVS